MMLIPSSYVMQDAIQASYPPTMLVLMIDFQGLSVMSALQRRGAPVLMSRTPAEWDSS